MRRRNALWCEEAKLDNVEECWATPGNAGQDLERPGKTWQSRAKLHRASELNTCRAAELKEAYLEKWWLAYLLCVNASVIASQSKVLVLVRTSSEEDSVCLKRGSICETSGDSFDLVGFELLDALAPYLIPTLFLATSEAESTEERETYRKSVSSLTVGPQTVSSRAEQGRLVNLIGGEDTTRFKSASIPQHSELSTRCFRRLGIATIRGRIMGTYGLSQSARGCQVSIHHHQGSGSPPHFPIPTSNAGCSRR